jgi:uncharacterized protein YutE (UPF0331/DUF86 family)
MNDVSINKVQIVQRCVQRAREEYKAADGKFASDYSHQDAAVMNVVRACEATLDFANHVVRVRRLGVPNSSADTFRALATAKILDAELADRLIRMVGFRNIAVHAYQVLNLEIVENVIQHGLDDLIEACDVLRKAADG